MQPRLRIFFTSAVAMLLIVSSAVFSDKTLNANNAGAPAGYTGSPGDNRNCTSCHSGTAQFAVGIISSNIPAIGYLPGTTYQITATVTDATRNRFGFQISPQNMTGTKLGTLSLVEATRTKLISSGKYITHTSSGTSGTGTNSWTFNWTAPQTGSGDVTFYGAFNFTNHNNASSGDVIKLCQMTVSEDVFTLGTPAITEVSATIYPNPTSGIVHFSLPTAASLRAIRIFSFDGRLVFDMEQAVNSGNNEIDLSSFSPGTYCLSLATDHGNFNTRIIKL